MVLQIVTAANPEGLMAELTAEEREAVVTVIKDNLVADVATVEVAPLSPAEAELVGLKYPKTKGSGPKAAAAAVAGCWSHYYYTDWSLLGTRPAASWMQLNWCGSNGKITDSSFSNVGGNSTGLGYDGNTRGKTNVGWEVRGVTTHEFSFYLVSVTKCMQVRGGASGLYSRSVAAASCELLAAGLRAGRRARPTGASHDPPVDQLGFPPPGGRVGSGVGTLWTSRRFSRRDKIVGSLLFPGG